LILEAPEGLSLMSTIGSSTTSSQMALSKSAIRPSVAPRSQSVLNNPESFGPVTRIGQFLKSKQDESPHYAIDELTAAVDEAVTANTPEQERKAKQVIEFLLPFAKFGLTDEEGNTVSNGFTDQNGFPHINRAINAGNQKLTGYLQTLGFKVAKPWFLELRQRQIPIALEEGDPAQLIDIMKTPGLNVNTHTDEGVPVIELAWRMFQDQHVRALVDQVPYLELDHLPQLYNQSFSYVIGDVIIFDIQPEDVTTTLLHKAARDGYVELCQKLLAKGVDPNKANNSNCVRTPLHEAAMNGRLDVVQVLLDNGADPNKITTDPNNAKSSGFTPLYLAVCLRKLEVVQALLASGAEPNQANNQGNTPLHIAVHMDELATIQSLLANGADPTQANESDQTPLELAVQYDNPYTVQLLVAKHRERTIKKVRQACTKMLQGIQSVFSSCRRALRRRNDTDD
jgi:hypothetical protein